MLETAAVTATWPAWPPREKASSPTTSVRPAAIAQIVPDALARQAFLLPSKGRASSRTVTEAPCATRADPSAPARAEQPPSRKPPTPSPHRTAMYVPARLAAFVAAIAEAPQPIAAIKP